MWQAWGRGKAEAQQNEGSLSNSNSRVPYSFAQQTSQIWTPTEVGDVSADAF